MKNWCWYCVFLSEPSDAQCTGGRTCSFISQNAEIQRLHFYLCINVITLYNCLVLTFSPHTQSLFFCLWSVSLCLLAKLKLVAWQNSFRNMRGANNNGDDKYFHKFISIFICFKTNFTVFLHTLSFCKFEKKKKKLDYVITSH